MDSITHDSKALHYIIDQVGIDKVTFGTDYPFPLGDLSFGSFIEEDNSISEIDKNKIFVTNTYDWLKINY